MKSEARAERAPRQLAGSSRSAPDQRPLGRRRALGRRRHAAVSNARADDASAFDIDTRSEHDGRNILVEPFRDLEGPIVLAFAKSWSGDREHELSGRTVLFAVGKKEVLEGQGPGRRALAQHDSSAKRDQRGRQIADRRAVGDIAADGAADADLNRAEPAHHFAEIGMDLGKQRRGVRERQGCAETELPWAVFDLIETTRPCRAR